jgi:two-component system cell cycle sensor histidine kinase PleC
MTEQNVKCGVLVVDDEPKMLTSIQDLLEEEFTVSTANNAETALRVLEQREIAVIVSDQRMPGIGGDEFLARARKVSKATRVLITGYSDMEALVRAVNNGQIYAYVAKPWSPAEFKMTVAAAVQHYQLMQEVAQERELLHALMDNIPDGIYFKDTASRFTRINRTQAQVLGVHDPREAIGKTEADFLSEEYARESQQDEQAIISSGLRVIDKIEELRKADGEVCWVSTTKVPFTATGARITGIIGISRDVSERKRQEEISKAHTELANANKELELHNREIQRSNQLKSHFLASVSHELRTPLNAMIGFSDLLAAPRTGELNQKQMRFIVHIRNGGRHLLQLINDILDLSKIEAGRLELHKEDLRVGEVVAEVLSVIRSLATNKNINIVEDLAANLWAHADRIRFRQILYNLLSNAIKFTPEHGTVSIQSRAEGNCARISVADTGAGIRPEDQQVIFEAFRQVGDTTRGAKEGTGLGLAITKQIVEQHGGRIWVESEPGTGSRFSFTVASQKDAEAKFMEAVAPARGISIRAKVTLQETP